MAKVDPKIKTRKRKINPILVVLVLVLIAITHFFMMTLPQIQQNADLTISLEEEKGEKKKLELDLEKAEKKAAELTPTDNEILRETQIPKSPEVTELLRYLENITPFENSQELKKIDLKSIAISEVSVSKKEERKQKVKQLKISLSFTTSPQAFRELLVELERSDKRIFTITDISAAESTEGPLSLRGKYSLTMIAYNQKPSK